MNYDDRTLVRLADPAGRAEVFDQDGLAQVIAAAYDTEVVPVEGPYRPVFDEFRIGIFAAHTGQLEGTWQQAGRAEITEARFRLSGMGGGPAVRVDALWRGSVVAQAAPEQARIVRAATAWPSLGAIDAEIVAALGALPANAAALEQERRTRLLARLRSALDQPEAFTNGRLDDWLASVGATSVTDLLTRFQGSVLPGTVTVAFSPAVDAPPELVTFPLAAAILVRDAGFSVAQLLADSKMIRTQLEPLGLERPRDAMLHPRGVAPIVWVVPAAVFDDADWPGGNEGMDAAALRAARRAAAGRWLAQEGIALVTTG